MTAILSQDKISEISNYDQASRISYFFKEVVANNSIWILTDEHGAVMLNTEDEDCIPVWPNEEFATAWATDEWQDCTAEKVSLNKWFSRWTLGLEDDGLAIVVFPNQLDEGCIFEPQEVEFEIKNAQKKR